MAWLSGWDNRIKLTIDHNKVDAALSHFPVTVFLSSTHGDCVFDELTADANRFKIAFTKADGITQLYGEIELWDDGNEKAVIHVSRSGWAISDSEDTIFYMYYDVDHADNTTYIGDIDSTPGASVWDANFKAVYHMVDATTSTIKDSTSNNNDGTKKGANEPVEAAGKIGQAQDFEPTDDEISLPTLTSVANYTVEFVMYPHLVGAGSGEKPAFSFENYDDTPREALVIKAAAANDTLDAYIDNIGEAKNYTFTINTWAHVAAIRDSTTISFYKDGADLTKDLTVGSGTVNFNNIRIGGHYFVGAEQEWFDGVIDEVRISNTNRAVAWIKATYNSLFDTLLTYGGSELKKELAESFSNTDSLVKNGTEQLAEAFSAIDSKITSVSWALTEAFSIADSLIKNGTEQLAEAFSIADSLVKNGIKSLAESFSITDFWAMLRRFTETVKVVDSIIKKHVITMMIRKIIIRVRGGSYESDIELED